MEMSSFRDEIKLKLTGNLLEIELDDSTIDSIINSALREMQRYICTTELVTIPFGRCIDLSEVKDVTGKNIKVSSVSRIYRTQGYIGENYGNDYAAVDPMYASQWQLLSGVGNLDNFQDYALNYASWNTLLQIRNTTSTDLSFKYDKSSNKLYINCVSNDPTTITVEYVPRFDSPEEIVSDYWIDVLVRLSVAIAKITVGRIRSRYTQSNSIWTQDGAQILEEGKAELNELRTHMISNSQLVYPID